MFGSVDSAGSALKQCVRVIKSFCSRLPFPVRQPPRRALLPLRYRPGEGPPWSPPRGSGPPPSSSCRPRAEAPPAPAEKPPHRSWNLAVLQGEKSHLIALHPWGSAAGSSIHESRVQKPFLYVTQESGHCSYTACEIYRNARPNERGAHLHKSWNSKAQPGRWLPNSALFAACCVHVAAAPTPAGVCWAGGKVGGAGVPGFGPLG